MDKCHMQYNFMACMEVSADTTEMNCGEHVCGTLCGTCMWNMYVELSVENMYVELSVENVYVEPVPSITCLMSRTRANANVM